MFPRMVGRENKPIQPAPDLGQHNEEVYGGMLGMSDEQRRELAAAGVI